MARIQKTSQEHNLSIFDTLDQKHISIEDRQPEMKQPRQKESSFDHSVGGATAAPKLSHNSIDEIDMVRGKSSVRSARCGNISNDLSSNNAMGVAGKNTICNPDFLDKLAEAVTNKERTLAEKDSIQNQRSTRQSDYKNSGAVKLGEDDEAYLARNASSIDSSSREANNKGWVPNGTISIFDNEDFERVQPTLGEQMTKKEASKDDSWRSYSKNATVRDQGLSAFDKMAESHDSEYRNHHQDSTDKLFEILKASKKVD